MTTAPDAPATQRPLVDAAVIAALSIGGALVGLNGMWASFRVFDVEPSAVISTAIALVACVVSLGKRRWPRTTLAVTIALWIADVLLTGGGLGTLLVVLDAVWAASYFGSDRVRRQTLGVVIGLTVLSGAATLLAGKAPIAALTVMISIGALLGTSFWAATAVARARELAELQRRARETDAAAAARERAAVVQDERDAMARELHDVVAGHVSAVALRAEAALLGPADADTDRAALRAVRDSSLQAHEALRTMITVLRDGGDVHAPDTLAAVPALIADAKRAGLTVTTTIAVPADLPVAIEQTAARVVREGLQNAVRHGDGDSAEVTIDGADGVLRVRVRSSGTTDAALPSTGWGLTLMDERVTALGGRTHAGPASDGWLLAVDLPLGEDSR